MEGLDAIGDMISALLEAVVALVEATIHSIVATAYLAQFLGCLLAWSFMGFVGHQGNRPELRRVTRKHKTKKVWRRIGAGLLPLVLGASLFGAFFLHDHHFRNNVSFKTTKGFFTGPVEFEWVSNDGKRSKADTSGILSKSYLTYRWNKVRITDPRYEPQVVTLDGKSQVIPVTPTAEELARRAEQRKETGKLLGKAALALGKEFFDKTIDEVATAEEPADPPTAPTDEH